MHRVPGWFLCGLSLLAAGCASKPAPIPSGSPTPFAVDYDEKIKEIRDDPKIPADSKQQAISALEQEKAAQAARRAQTGP